MRVGRCLAGYGAGSIELLSNQLQVVAEDVKGDMQLKPLFFLRRAPGASKEAIDVGSEHRAGVIETKQRIKDDLL